MCAKTLPPHAGIGARRAPIGRGVFDATRSIQTRRRPSPVDAHLHLFAGNCARHEEDLAPPVAPASCRPPPPFRWSATASRQLAFRTPRARAAAPARESHGPQRRPGSGSTPLGHPFANGLRSSSACVLELGQHCLAPASPHGRRRSTGCRAPSARPGSARAPRRGALGARPEQPSSAPHDLVEHFVGQPQRTALRVPHAPRVAARRPFDMGDMRSPAPSRRLARRHPRSAPAHADRPPPLVERVEHIVFAELDRAPAGAAALCVVPLERAVDARAGDLERNRPAPPSRGRSSNAGPTMRIEVTVVLPSQVRLDGAAVLVRVTARSPRPRRRARCPARDARAARRPRRCRT